MDDKLNELELYLKNYNKFDRDRGIKYGKEYYNREGMKEKRSKYNKEYYKKKKKYILCKKCNITILEHNFDLHKGSFTHINGRRKTYEECKKIKVIIEEPVKKQELLDKIEFII